jgi:PAS domain S-box-containing protein
LFSITEPDFTIVEVNQAREQLVGIDREHSVGRPLFEVFPDISKKFRETGESELLEHIRQVIRSAKPVHLHVFRYDIPTTDGGKQVRYWQSTYLPVSLGNVGVSHILAATRDVTLEHATENRMLRAEERLEAALAIGKVGSWVWEVEKDIVVADPNLTRMFGIDQKLGQRGIALENFMDAIHPEDRERVRRAIVKSVRTLVPFEEEYRTTSLNGTRHWVLARGSVEQRAEGKLFTGVIVDITERRDLQAQVELAHQQDQLNRQSAKILQSRNDELEAIARTKDEFVALASHQLRTPATAVKQYLGMVLQGYVGEVSEVQEEMLGKAFESNERQIQIINQILNAARADTGRLIMTPVAVDLRSLVQGTADDMRASFEQRDHSFKISLPKQPVPIMADLGYMRMAIENLLHNASIYTPNGGEITMRLTKAGGQCRLSITDNGVGIKKSDLGKLFAKFSRIHNPLSVQAGGSGIGLYLTGEIIRLHHGHVTVDSKIRQGTTFAISLPVVQ